jgi:glucose-1-phosphate adenylyltransferase
VYQNLYSIMREKPRRLIVLAGDHVYKMDYARMLRFHEERGAAAQPLDHVRQRQHTLDD